VYGGGKHDRWQATAIWELPIRCWDWSHVLELCISRACD
jgi:hypothetical protein